MTGFLIGAGLFMLGGFLALFPGEKIKAPGFIIPAFLAQCFILPAAVGVLIHGVQLEIPIFISDPIGVSFLRMDALAALFVVIISIGGLLSAVYSAGYMKMYAGRKAALSSYYFFLGLMIVSMLFVVVVQNALLFLVCWEIMSLASFFLVSFEHEKKEVRKAGIYYFVAMQTGAAFLIAAFSWTSALSGSFDFNSFASVLNGSNSASILLLVLFLLGFGTKAGFFPLHTWLPRAHPAAPTGVSALMSGVMIKTGIYGILRMLLLAGKPNEALAYSIFFIALVTGVIGIVGAISQSDLKKLLAYSSMENIGIIGIGIGLGQLGRCYNQPEIAFLGFFGALLHVVNHFAFKSVLFYGAGIVYTRTHTRIIDRLGGLLKQLPAASVLFLIASLAICGLPALNGFVSEFSLFLGMAKSLSMMNLPMNIASLLGMSGLAFIGIMAFVGFTKVYGIVFLGTPRTLIIPDTRAESRLMLLPMYALTALIFAIGMLPFLAVQFLAKATLQFLPSSPRLNYPGFLPAYSTLSGALLLFGALFLLLFALRFLLLRRRTVAEFRTWDCGYQGASGRMQYTGSSYSQPFLSLVRELAPQKVHGDTVQALFPGEAHIESHTQDISERYFIQPMILYLRRFMNLFAGIQSGRMQQYIAYGLVFLILILLWIFGGK